MLVERDGPLLLPELYYVPADRVAAEKARPHSQERVPDANVPLVWAQSLYLLGRMIREGFLQPGDIDPLGRHRHKPPSEPVVQLALLAEDAALQAELAVEGVMTETPQALQPVEVYEQAGRQRLWAVVRRAAALLGKVDVDLIYAVGAILVWQKAAEAATTNR